MCGLAGVARLAGPAGPEHESLVRRMLQLQAYRGPDDSGVVSIDNVCLGSLRLSIIDLSPAGHMPMSDASGRWWIAYNGEVYNFQELRRELEGLGHQFHSSTDTEVVLHAFMQWGEDGLDRLTGIFAFAVFDRVDRVVTLVRDPYGVKPLYYTTLGADVCFASEMKAVAAVLPRPSVDRQSVIEWALYENVDSLLQRTLLENVSSVLPGQLVEIRDGRARVREYHTPTADVSIARYAEFSRASPRAIISELDAVLRECVRTQLVSDVPVGTLVSGGLDSSLVTAMAARYTRNLTGFHVSVQGMGALDEKPYAEQVAHKLGLPLVTCELTGRGFRRELARVAFWADQPLTHPNSVAYASICRLAREHGVIVLLSGEGADELFGGYSFRYRRYRRILRLNSVLRHLPGRVRSLLALVGFASAGLPTTSFHIRELLPHTVALIDSYARYDWLKRCEAAYSFLPERDERAVLAAMLADLGDFLTPLLGRLDRMSMSASVECRVPYLDRRLVQRAINLPLSLRLRGRSDKWMLKRIAVQYLPRSLVERKKAGFPLPMHDYVAPLADMDLFTDGFCLEELGFKRSGLRHAIEDWAAHVHGFFGLVALEMWGRLFVRRQSSEEVGELIERLEEKHARAVPAG